MSFPDNSTLYHLIILGSLLLSLAALLANLSCFDGLREAAPFPPDAPLVSILVPARNEARNIDACVSSLLAQDYPNWELFVLDDHSTDGTGTMVEKLVAGNGRARMLTGADLPPGWTGKAWACHQLAGAARGDFLFFTDADTVHAPGTVAAAVACAQQHRLDLLSAWPRLLTISLGEKLIIPQILVLGMIFYPHWLLILMQNSAARGRDLRASLRRNLGAANGQFMFFSRSGYERIGGHEALRDHLVEDVALGRAVASRMHEGLRLMNCDALRFSTCRMYRSFAETWEGFTKNIRPAFEESLAGFLMGGVINLCLLFLPFVLVFVAPVHRPLILAQIAVIYLIRVILTVRFRTSWWSCILHPLGHALALAIGLNSWRRSARGGVSWKGRTYQMARPD